MSPFDPRGKANRALLVGVSEYDVRKPTPHGVPGDLPAVRHNLDRLKEVLPGGRVFGAHEVTVVRSPYQHDFQRALRTAAEEAEGLLLVYFAGHGAVPSAANELFLQMRGAEVYRGRQDSVFPGAEMFTTVLTMLHASRAERIVVVLDCCYAGNAAFIWEQFPDRRRVLLLMSVQANNRIDAGDDGTPTPFTKELAELLASEGELTFGGLSERLRDRMRAAGLRTVRGEEWEPLSRTEPQEDVLLSAPPKRVVAPPDTGSLDGRSGPHREESERPPGGRTRGRSPRLPRRFLRALGAWFGGLRVVSRIALVLLALATLGLGSYGLSALRTDGSSCAPPLELRVLTDPDLEPTVTAAADAYLTSGDNTDGDGCRRTGITVYSAGAADAVNALRRQTEVWKEPHDEDTNPQRDIGPQPDVWIPASPADVARVTAGQDTDNVARLEAAEQPLAYSPVVLAVPDDIAVEPLGERTGQPLAVLLKQLKARAEQSQVRRPDPEFADAALLATLGLYGTGTDPARAERQVAQAGPPSRTAADLLCALPDDTGVDSRTAALVPEFLLRTGVGCDRTTRAPRTAEYPDDVPGVEATFVRVRWDDADRDGGERDRAAARFHAWLSGDGGRAVFARDGFRSASHGRELLDARDVAHGVLRDPSPLTEAAGRQAMESALKRYRRANGPGRVLYLLDDSGSMSGLWDGPSGGPGLLKQSLGGLGGADEYGVWGVSGTGGKRPYEELLGFGPHSRKEAERAVDAATVRDAEADPHAALLAALDDMRGRGLDDDRPQLVVYITDDEDDTRLTDGNLDDVLARARSAKVPVTMVSLVSGGCDRGKPDARISDASGGRCLDADDDLGAGLTDEVARTGMGED
ncbi:substrate-binding domain-containing protein [Streptomyces cylindrosporus]|uniref:Substrate-binding domain-containing protein n=1 Tax=Streptomyces cylindrosporus TaxID=2927583 RepID=A0ABS9YC70_9ACTN|nr:substrate-binding domain-containing protein [Streptomyces cylindrosporus]MCI3274832.1 substrate-binding domain-containing protein [Streptomyces cylindrosporus]